MSLTISSDQPPSINLSKLIAASLMPTVVLAHRVAALEGTSREQVIAEVREELDRSWGEET